LVLRHNFSHIFERISILKFGNHSLKFSFFRINLVHHLFLFQNKFLALFVQVLESSLGLLQLLWVKIRILFELLLQSHQVPQLVLQLILHLLLPLLRGLHLLQRLLKSRNLVLNSSDLSLSTLLYGVLLGALGECVLERGAPGKEQVLHLELEVVQVPALQSRLPDLLLDGGGLALHLGDDLLASHDLLRAPGLDLGERLLLGAGLFLDGQRDLRVGGLELRHGSGLELGLGLERGVQRGDQGQLGLEALIELRLLLLLLLLALLQLMLVLLHARVDDAAHVLHASEVLQQLLGQLVVAPKNTKVQKFTHLH